jgi:hypothetical protein
VAPETWLLSYGESMIAAAIQVWIRFWGIVEEAGIAE